nr:uncharacterized mitochondrial protein AtMg00860-like [Parasteatoda tepidariorum]
MTHISLIHVSISHNLESSLEHLNCALQRIKVAELSNKPSKCRFAQDHVLYLRRIVGQGYRKPSDIRAVAEFSVPKIKTEIRAFLGLAGYYSRYKPIDNVEGYWCSTGMRTRENRLIVTSFNHQELS